MVAPRAARGGLVLTAVVGAEHQVEATRQHGSDEGLRAARAPALPPVRQAHHGGCVAAVGEPQRSDGGPRRRHVVVQGGSGHLVVPSVRTRSVRLDHPAPVAGRRGVSSDNRRPPRTPVVGSGRSRPPGRIPVRRADGRQTLGSPPAPPPRPHPGLAGHRQHPRPRNGPDRPYHAVQRQGTVRSIEPSGARRHQEERNPSWRPLSARNRTTPHDRPRLQHRTRGTACGRVR
jgi:hypothetical protein